MLVKFAGSEDENGGCFLARERSNSCMTVVVVVVVRCECKAV